MATKISRARSIILAAVLLLALAATWARLFHLQVLNHEKYIELARRRHSIQVPIPSDRGKIYDRNGRLLATSVMGKSVFVDPAEIEDLDLVAAGLGKALNLDPACLAREIGARMERRFFWIKRLAEPSEVAELRSMALPGVRFREEPKRFYPNGTMLCHLLGFTGIDQTGMSGVELYLDSRLRGRDGLREEGRDGLARSILDPQMEYRPPRNGSSVYMTIDANIQDFLEAAADRCVEEYAPLGLTAIVMDPATGEILALTERPLFNPNRYAESPPETWRLRAVTDPFEPGSMFKPFVFAAGLEAGVVKLDDIVFCENGEYRIGRRLLHDHHAYGDLSGRDVVVKSSNIGMAKIGLALGPVKTYEYLRAFGFGRKSGMRISGEDPGRLMPLENWSNYTMTSVPMGHEVSVTAMQMVAAFSAFANGGYLVTPRIVRCVVGPDGKADPQYGKTEVRSQVVRPETADLMLTDVLYSVVKNGTGRLANLEDYDIAGKTGTAQKLVDGRYSHSKYVCSFICAGPVQDPRAVVLFVVDEPTRGVSRFGGTAAAPFAAEVLESTLDYMFIDGKRRAKSLEYAVATRPAPTAEVRHAP